MRILVTGSRKWVDQAIAWSAIEEAIPGELGPDERIVIVHGGAQGADSMAGAWVEHVNEPAIAIVECHPANWKDLGKRAGIIRNEHMVNLGADLCLAFIRGNSRGASHCAGLAASREIPVRYFRDDG